MSERKDGSMKIFQGSDLNLENRRVFFEKNGISESEVVSAEIAQGNQVEIVRDASAKIILGADGLATQSEDVFLAVTVADCIPVYFFDPTKGIIAIAHCGWKGIVSGVVENSILKMAELGTEAKDVQVAIGPGLFACHFEIKEDILERFKKYEEFIIKKEGKIFVDLKGSIKKQLTGLQVKIGNIEESEECTFEGEKFFSYRRDKPQRIEAMVAVIGMKKN